MHRPAAAAWNDPGGGNGFSLAALSAAFAAGGAAGMLLTAYIAGDAAEGLELYIRAFLEGAGRGTVLPPAPVPLLWQTVRWPLLAALLGLTPLGMWVLPPVFAARGFLFAFAVAAFVRVLGSFGGLAAAVIFGLSGVITIPVLFLLGVQAMTASRQLARGSPGERKGGAPPGKRYFLRCGVCSAALLFSVLLEYTAVPPLTAVLSGLLPG